MTRLLPQVETYGVSKETIIRVFLYVSLETLLCVSIFVYVSQKRWKHNGLVQNHNTSMHMIGKHIC